jgi:hypothetical protein
MYDNIKILLTEQRMITQTLQEQSKILSDQSKKIERLEKQHTMHPTALVSNLNSYHFFPKYIFVLLSLGL